MKQKTIQNKNITPIVENIISIFILILISAIVLGITYILNRPITEMLRNTITVSWGCLAVLFLWYQSVMNQSLEYDNEKHKLRFFSIYFLCFLISIGMIFLPGSSWVFLSIMVVLAMFSNMVIGLTAGSVLLLTTVTLTNSGNMYDFFLYFMIGLIGISLFRNLDLDFKIAQPLFLSGISSFVLQTAYEIIFQNQKLQLEIILMPVLNLILNLIFLFLILKYFSGLAMYLRQDKYAEINDQEFPIMAELKKNHKDQYFEAIHTAYLGARIAKKLNLNEEAVKGCCYYYKVSKNVIKTQEGDKVPLPDYYDFPEDLKLLLEECYQGKYGSKEACVVLTSNKVIRAIKKAQKEWDGEAIPYGDIITNIFHPMIYGDLLNQCDISMKELSIMKKTYIEEKLYYDFLH